MAGSLRDAFMEAGVAVQNTTRKGSNNSVQEGKEPHDSLLDDYVDRAEKVILKLSKDREYSKLTTSKLRNIFSIVSEIYNDVLSEKSERLTRKIQDRIMHLKVRLVYECGREEIVKKFYKEAGLDSIIAGMGDSPERFVAFARYMEALVAYHRFYGDTDR
jgi:CRISPR-associated protein Csm2